MTNIQLVLQIIMAAMQLAPELIISFDRIKTILAGDPTIPEGLRAILADTQSTNEQTLDAIRQWREENPQA
jgi:hypothetical protein